MLCAYGAVSSTYFVGKEQKKWVFTVVATASFLAGTRNLVSGSVLCFRGHLHCHLDKIPGPSQGLRIADIATSFSVCLRVEDGITEEVGV